jgi:2-polyprenyl-6-methoxyphenol hydroxylase-like FAD-dependent oxidoreductase
MPEQVLIVGAGPTGLVLALWLTRLGIRPRLIDRADRPGTTSRAFAVHARTLEFYDQIGIAEQVIAAGDQMQVLNIHIRRKPIAQVPFGTFGGGLSAFPFILMLPQDEHEQLLGEQLQRQAVSVEWRPELAGFEERRESVRVVVRGPDGPPASCETAFLCGCGGAHSAVREHLGTGFPAAPIMRCFTLPMSWRAARSPTAKSISR